MPRQTPRNMDRNDANRDHGVRSSGGGWKVREASSPSRRHYHRRSRSRSRSRSPPDRGRRYTHKDSSRRSRRSSSPRRRRSRSPDRDRRCGALLMRTPQPQHKTVHPKVITHHSPVSTTVFHSSSTTGVAVEVEAPVQALSTVDISRDTDARRVGMTSEVRRA